MIMTKGKVQTNDYGNNILVETTNSSNQHWHYTNKPVEVIKVLSKEEVIAKGLEVLQGKTIDEQYKALKRLLMQEEGYASSNCSDDSIGLRYGDIVQFELINKQDTDEQ